MKYINYTIDIEKYLLSSKFIWKQIPNSYWRREMIRIDLNNMEYSFIPFESSPFDPIISYEELIKL